MASSSPIIPSKITDSDLPTYDPETQSCTGSVNVKFDHEKVFSKRVIIIDLVIDINKNYTLCILNEQLEKTCYDLAHSTTVASSPELLTFYPVDGDPVVIWTASHQIMKDWMQTLHVLTALANIRDKNLCANRSEEDLKHLTISVSEKLSFKPLKKVGDKVTNVSSKVAILEHLDKTLSSSKKIDYMVKLNDSDSFNNAGQQKVDQRGHEKRAGDSQTSLLISPVTIDTSDGSGGDEHPPVDSLRRSKSNSELKIWFKATNNKW
jgi:hypothetical protein